MKRSPELKMQSSKSQEAKTFIDVNTSVGNWPFSTLKYTSPYKLTRLMNRLGTTCSFVAPLEGLFYKDTQVANRQMYKAISKYYPKLLPFYIINPRFPGWKEDITECIRNMKMTGIRIFPGYHGYKIEDRCCIELFRQLNRLSIPLQIAPRIYDTRMHHPRFLVKDANIQALPGILCELPELRVCVLNLRSLQEVFKEKEVLHDFENCFIDISFFEGVDCISKLLEYVSINNILFGTNAPLLIALSAKYKLKEADLNPKQLDAIMRTNPFRFLEKSIPLVTGPSKPEENRDR